MYSFVIPHIILKAKEYGLLFCCYCWFPSVCLISWTETLTLKRNNPIYRCGARPNKTFIAVSFFYPSHVFCIHWFNLFDIFHDVFPKKTSVHLTGLSNQIYPFFIAMFFSYHHFWKYITSGQRKGQKVKLSTVYLVLYFSQDVYLKIVKPINITLIYLMMYLWEGLRSCHGYNVANLL